MMSGAALTVGQFGNWTPIGAERAADGTYRVAWKNGVLVQYIGWNFDSSGNYLAQGAIVAGGTWYAEAPIALHQDLNSDSTTGPATATTRHRSTAPGGHSPTFSYASNGPQLTMNGAYGRRVVRQLDADRRAGCRATGSPGRTAAPINTSSGRPTAPATFCAT
jgi:hypothetical protein